MKKANKVYRIGTFKVSPDTRIGDKEKGHQQAMDILFSLAGVVEYKELMANYPELGIEINGVPLEGYSQES